MSERCSKRVGEFPCRWVADHRGKCSPLKPPPKRYSQAEVDAKLAASNTLMLQRAADVLDDFITSKISDGHYSGPPSEYTALVEMHRRILAIDPSPQALEDYVRERVAALQAFKDYVHKRLDDAGIPTDPPSEHRDAGCRIGGRLDVVLDQLAKIQAATALQEAKTWFTRRWGSRVSWELVLESEGSFTPECESDARYIRQLATDPSVREGAETT